jgi:8-oxo-dGTP pyrophosphatase MutT (NUDIX family)
VSAPSSPVAALRHALETHRPADDRERWSVRRTLALMAWLPRPLDADADPSHVTAAAIVVDGERVLLHRHKRLGRWLQPGGHVDPGEGAPDAALRETLEETGLRADHPPGGPDLIHVDVHEGPRGHVHLDVRYRLLGDASAPLVPAPGESRDVRWCTPAEVAAVGDPSLLAAVRAALTRSPGGPR